MALLNFHELPNCGTSAEKAFELLMGRRRRRDEPLVFTYAVSDGTFLKIGRARHVVRRFTTLQSSNPRDLTLVGFRLGDIEAYAHEALRTAGVSRVRGEWFEDGHAARLVLYGLKLDTQPEVR